MTNAERPPRRYLPAHKHLMGIRHSEQRGVWQPTPKVPIGQITRPKNYPNPLDEQAAFYFLMHFH